MDGQEKSSSPQPSTAHESAPSPASEATQEQKKTLASEIAHYFKGLVSLWFVVFVGALYWLVMLWDIKGIGRRSRHYRIKVNNTWRSFFDRAYVTRHEAWRQGECAHCGACCEILWRCPFLRTDKETKNSYCSVHKSRPLPCRTFPIDPKTVELISVDRPADNGCSYRFQQIIDQKRLELEAKKRQTEEKHQRSMTHP